MSDVYTFYNNQQNQSLDRRDKSKVLHLRNFNNRIKSTLINQYLERIRNEQPRRSNKIRVLDMGCGKGGDQPKWDIGRMKFVTFTDRAENLVAACRERYNDPRNRYCYAAEFFPLDCTKELLRDKLRTTKPCYDLVSSQFVIHYSFDTLQSANRFLRNAAELLRVGGYFIGTTINSCDLVERCRRSSNQSISNDIFQMTFDSSIDLSKTSNKLIPLFGAKYHCTLADVVDCSEYLVYFPLLEHLANKRGLEKVDRQTFKDYFDSNHQTSDDRHSLMEMNQHRRSCRTLSQQDWEVSSLYIIFAFKKVQHVKYEEDV